MDNEASNEEIQGAGISLAPPKTIESHREYQSVCFLGCVLYTDRWGLRTLMERSVGDPVLTEQIDLLYPGFTQAAVRAIFELESKNIPVSSLVFMNGQVQVWPDRVCAGAMPSDFYPTEVTPLTPGYEAVLEQEIADAQAELDKAKDAEREEMYSMLDAGLAGKVGDTLAHVRMAALAMQDHQEDYADVIAAIRTKVGRWGMTSKENAQLVIRHLGPIKSSEAVDPRSALWILGEAFPTWCTANDLGCPS